MEEEQAKLVGAKERVEEIAADLVEHCETRTSVLEGKEMVVAMSRDICVSLFDEIIKLVDCPRASRGGFAVSMSLLAQALDWQFRE